MIYFLLSSICILQIAALWQARRVYLKFEAVKDIYDNQMNPLPKAKQANDEANTEASFLYGICIYILIAGFLTLFFYRHEIKLLICQ